MHWRRGHWRTYKKPTREGKLRIRIPAYCAGNPELGIIHKTYEIV